jgi:hypothetical protein
MWSGSSVVPDINLVTASLTGKSNGYQSSVATFQKAGAITEVADGLAPALRQRGIIRSSYSYELSRDDLLEF